MADIALKSESLVRHIVGKTPINSIDAIIVAGSVSEVYEVLMNHKPNHELEAKFKNNLEKAIRAGVETFRVPVCDPSINEITGKLQFVPNYKPAIGYCYNELEKLAQENGIRLGIDNQYYLFLGTIINRLMIEGWRENVAWNAVCVNSKELGNYADSTDAKGIELTGSRKIVGKCDLGNVCKILANNKIISCAYWTHGEWCPIANVSVDYCRYSVGWYVF